MKPDQNDIERAGHVLLEWQNRTRWQIRKEFENEHNQPHVLDIVDSLYFLINNPDMSVSRVADGELGLMTGVAIPNSGYQHHDGDLQKSLRKVMTCDRKRCRIALPKWFLFWCEPVQARDADSFVKRNFGPSAIRGLYFGFFKPDYLYLDACMSVPCAHYGTLGDEFVSAYYCLVKKLLSGQDVILVTGDDRYSTMEHRLLQETVNSMSVINVPSREAWTSYDTVKSSLMNQNGNGDKTVILCCGPMASVVAYDLSDYMRCLDLGHMLVDYNLSKKGQGTGRFWG